MSGEVVEFFLRVSGTDEAAGGVKQLGDVTGITADEAKKLTGALGEVSDAEKRLIAQMKGAEAAAKARADMLGLTVAEYKRVQAELKKVTAAEQEAAEATAKTGDAAGSSALSWSSMVAATKKVPPQLKAITAAATVAGGAMLKLTKEVNDFINGINDMSIRTGFSSETLVGLSGAAAATGESLNSLNGPLQEFTGRIAQAAEGSGAAFDAFDDLGVGLFDVADGSLRSVDDILRQTVDILAAIPGKTDRATAAVAVFGNEGAKLAQALAGGSVALDEWTAKAARAGVVVGGDAAKGAAEFQKTMAELEVALQGAKQALADDFTPKVIEALERLSGVIFTFTQVYEVALGPVLEALNSPLNPAHWAFALLGYLMLRGWFDRRVLPIVGSIAIGLMYGGALFGMFPGQAGISWEGHLFGFIGGVVAARWLAKREQPATG